MSRRLPVFAVLTASMAAGLIFSPLLSVHAQAPAPQTQAPAPVRGQSMDMKVLVLQTQIAILQQQIAALQASLDLLKASTAAQLEKQGLSSPAPKPAPHRSNIPPSKITLLKQTR